MLTLLLCRQAKMAAGLARDAVTKNPKGPRQVLAGHIARQSHAGVTARDPLQ
jgi:hypothetical protein